MNTTKIWIYGVKNEEVIKTTWVFNHVSDEHLESIAKYWKAEFGCDHVYAMMDSKELHDSWLVYVKTRNLRNGLAAFNALEFIDYLQSGDWELAVA